MPMKLPTAKAEVPKIDFTALNTAIEHLKAASARLNDRWTAATGTPGAHKEMNEKLYRAEQQLLSADGLPRRPWYKHTIYAPGFYTGYGVKTLPGIREAIEQRNWTEAQQQIGVVAAAVMRLAGYLKGVGE